MSRVRVCVVKVGGSLFARQNMGQRLRDWLAEKSAQNGATHFVLIAGGGALVDAVREMDRRFALEAGAVHWICVDLLNITSQLLAAVLPEVESVDQFSRLERRLGAAGVTVFAPRQFLAEIEPQSDGTRLASDWSVTSDSIAGRLAVVLAADELVLLKSAAAPPVAISGDRGWKQLSEAGYVDEFLCELASELPLTSFVDMSAMNESPGDIAKTPAILESGAK